MYLMGKKKMQSDPIFTLRHKSNWIFPCRLPNFEQKKSGRFFS
jgi:hypothetical protein